MADKLNLLQLNNGVPAESAVNGYIYVVVDGVDYFIAFDDFIKSLLEPYDAIINIPGGSTYPISNPFTLPKIPRIVELTSSDGTIKLTPSINQTSGDMTIYSIVPLNDMNLKILGW